MVVTVTLAVLAIAHRIGRGAGQAVQRVGVEGLHLPAVRPVGERLEIAHRVVTVLQVELAAVPGVVELKPLQPIVVAARGVDQHGAVAVGETVALQGDLPHWVVTGAAHVTRPAAHRVQHAARVVVATVHPLVIGIDDAPHAVGRVVLQARHEGVVVIGAPNNLALLRHALAPVIRPAGAARTVAPATFPQSTFWSTMSCVPKLKATN